MARLMQLWMAFLVLLAPFVEVLPQKTAKEAKAPTGHPYYFPVIGYDRPWEGLGPDGGVVTPVVLSPKNPKIGYTGTWGAGVYRTTDGGANWVAASTGLTNLMIQSMAIDPVNPEIAYAGTYRSGVFKTLDSGRTWTSASAGLNREAIVYALAVDPSRPNTIYAGTRSPGSTPPWGGGVYKSTDGGQTWSNHSNNLAEDWVYGLAIDPKNPQTLYAALHQTGISKSTDGGHSWTTINNGVYDQSGRTVAVDPSNPQVVYFGVWHGTGVFKSTNGGKSWTVSSNGLGGAKLIAVVVDPVRPSTLYALSYLRGLFKSTDGGASWAAEGLSSFYAFSMAVDTSQHDHLLVSAFNEALYGSQSGGTAWMNSSSGLHATTVTASAADPATAGLIYAGTNGQGVYRSTDNGKTWSAPNAGLGDRNIRALLANPGMLLAATQGGGIYRSSDNGQSWVSGSQGLPAADAKTLFDQPALRRFVTWGPVEDLLLEEMGATGWDIAQSKEVTTVPMLSLASAASSPATIYAGSAGSGVYKSTNSGANWLSAGLGGKVVLAVAVEAGNPNVVYAGSDAAGGSCWKSLDGGKVWVQIQSGLAGLAVLSLSVHPSKAGVIYAGTSSGIFASSNGGASWTRVALSGIGVNAVLVYPYAPSTVLAGTDAGIKISKDDGKIWGDLSAGIVNPQVWSLSAGASAAKMIYAGTQTSGMYRYSMPGK